MFEKLARTFAFRERCSDELSILGGFSSCDSWWFWPLVTGKYGCRKVRVYPAECGEQLGRDPSKNGSSKSLVLTSFSGEGTLWDSSLSITLALWDRPVLCAPPPLPLSQDPRFAFGTKSAQRIFKMYFAYPLTRNYYENNSLRIAFRNFWVILCSENLQERKTFPGFTRDIRNFYKNNYLRKNLRKS